LGGANVTPVLSSAVGADLDGDGTVEVLVAASYIDYVNPPQGPQPSKAGPFSIVYVRHVVGNAATSKVISSVGVKETPQHRSDLVIDGAADINGDGVMEVLDSGYLYEAANFYCWDAGSADRPPKTHLSYLPRE
jgi:hypothetical protein